MRNILNEVRDLAMEMLRQSVKALSLLQDSLGARTGRRLERKNLERVVNGKGQRGRGHDQVDVCIPLAFYSE